MIKLLCTLLLTMTLGLTAGCASAQLPWLEADGTTLVNEQGEPFRIDSICFGIEDVLNGLTLPLDEMYADIVRMGFNAVTLQLDYLSLKQGAAWGSYSEDQLRSIDRHVDVAEANGLYVVFNLYVAPENGNGSNVFAYQREDEHPSLAFLWKALARRYADRSCVIGYSLLDEPLMQGNTAEEAYAMWCSLASRMVESIRQEDTRHVIFLEQSRRWYRDAQTGQSVEFDRADMCFPPIDDENIVLQFQFYHPYAFIAQAWSNPQDTPYLVYPSEFYAAMKEETGTILTTQNDQFDISEQGWDTLHSELYTVRNPDIRYVRPCVSLWKMGYGEVWIDEMILSEYDETGKLVAQPLHLTFNSETSFTRYAPDGEVLYVPTGGKDGVGGTLYIRGVQEGYAVLEDARVPVKQGYSYQLSFIVGGVNLSYESSVSPMLEFHCGADPYRMDSEYLDSLLQPYVDYAEQRQLPLFAGGFGTMWSANDHGAAAWVRDMNELFQAHNISSNYFIYRNDYLGLYRLDGAVNWPIYEYYINR